jgi:hypothetical protein
MRRRKGAVCALRRSVRQENYFQVRLRLGKSAAIDREKVFSERNRWRVAVDPDTTKPGPWSENIYFGSDSNEEVWKLTFIDQIGVDTRWLNEKLVYGQVSWGRIYATEFILDTQEHKFIYREMANYGVMTEPCQ